MRVARLIIYDGPDDLVQRQLGASQADGVRSRLQGGVEMTVVTLPSTALYLIDQAARALVAMRDAVPVPIGQDPFQAESERGADNAD